MGESELQISDWLIRKHCELVKFLHQHLNTSGLHFFGSGMSCLKSLPHFLCRFVVAYPVELLRAQGALNIVDGLVIQFHLEVIIIGEAGSRLLKTFIIKWNIVTMLYNIPDSKATALIKFSILNFQKG